MLRVDVWREVQWCSTHTPFSGEAAGASLTDVNTYHSFNGVMIHCHSQP